MRCYLETNAIIRAEREGISGFSLRDRLAARGYSPVIGLTTMFELERGFSNTRLRPKVVRQFQVLRDLRPEWVKSSFRLEDAEFAFMDSREPVDAFLTETESVNPRDRVAGYAMGIPDPRSSAIERMIHTARDQRDDGRSIVERVKAFRRKHAKGMPEIKTKQQAACVVGLPRTLILSDIVLSKHRQGDTARVFLSLDDLPYLRARVLRHEYLCWIMVKDRQVPRLDKSDDSSHLAEAAYCDAILSGDNGLLGPMREYIAPQLRPMHMDDVVGFAGDGWAEWRSRT